MQASTDRILTTHSGSLHRPPDLEEMFRKKLAGEAYDKQAFEARLRSSVADIVQQQVTTGIDVIDDGEFSKVDFFSYAKYRLDGIETRPVPARADDKTSANKFLHPAMKSVMSSLAVRQKFAAFFADTEPKEGAVWPGSVIQMYVPVGTAVELPALYFVTGPLRYKRDEIDRDIANFARRSRAYRSRTCSCRSWRQLCSDAAHERALQDGRGILLRGRGCAA